MRKKLLFKLVARNIERCRKKSGLTQEQAAEKGKFHYKYYQRLERQAGSPNVTLETLNRVSNALDIHPQELFKPLRSKS